MKYLSGEKFFFKSKFLIFKISLSLKQLSLNSCTKISFPRDGITLINFLLKKLFFSLKIDKSSSDDNAYKGTQIPFAIPRAKDTPTLIL